MRKKIQKYIRYFLEDKTGTISLVSSLLTRKILWLIYKPVVILFKLKGCKIGKGCKVIGIPLVVRFPNSSITIGNNVYFLSKSVDNYRGISHKCIINTGKERAQIIIGDNCGFSGCSIVADNYVKIGNHVTVGADTIIGDRDDHTDLYPSNPLPVVIGNDVWIGMHCIILKGVSIGSNSIIGAGSIVTKDIPANCIAAGVPCKIIKFI